MRVANLITETLVRAGVTHIFSLSGNQIMPIYDACLDSGLQIVHVRHESAAVFMADAWAQASGEIGVALVTAGAGYTNALAALYSVVCSESPVLLLSGDSPLSQDTTGAFQELDQVSMARPISKYSIRLNNAESVPNDLATAIRAAQSNRPGPVHVAVPFDLVNEDGRCTEAELDTLSYRETRSEGDRVKSDILVSQVGRRLSSARRPIVITGPACNGYRVNGRSDIKRLSRVVPVVAMESPRGLRDPALGDFKSVLKAADVIVLLGKRVDFTLSFADQHHFADDVEFMVIDTDKTICEQAQQALGERALFIEQANILSLLQPLVVELESLDVSWTDWQVKVATAVNRRLSASSDHAEISSEKDGIHPAVLCREVQSFLNSRKQAIAVCDGGEFGQWAQAGTNVPMRIINGTSGGIGAGPCYGIAAKLNQPDATVVVFVGDGTVGFHLAEFETAVRQDVPLIVVVGHDARWNAEVEIQRRDYGEDRLIGCELAPTRYDLAVAAMGGHGEYVTRPIDVMAALKRAEASGKPACINVRLNGQPAPDFAQN